ncbi:CHAD domain-containing protein [Ruegeria sp. ANG-S4]|uniref:CHAD domain-containing protein n=1 Tax=Ruegeria sp. ANG-S4 TaxID=1577904 RepID=UPI000689ACCB|nr:CHAD domain-containing protein [Ruegeria sp. ANG-S4]
MTGNQSAFFVVPDGLSAETLAQALDRYTVESRPRQPERAFALLDCHDQSLQQSGRLLIEAAGMLRLYDNRGDSVSQRLKGRGRFPKDFPEGPMKQALSGFPKLRALGVVGEGHISRADFLVLDELQKTQAKLHVTALSSPNERVELVQVEGLRGYDRAFSAVSSAIAGIKGAQADVAAVFPQLFPGQARYQAKPHIPLGKTEPASEAATDIISTYLGVARQNEAGVIKDIDTEYLHDYRVSLRRIRSVLSLFKGVYSEAETAGLKRVFSDLMQPTGRVRDLDVYLLEKESFFNLVPVSLNAGLEEMFDAFQKERARELNRLSRWLRGSEYEKTMRSLAARFESATDLASGPSANLGAYEYACALIWKRYRKVCKLARSITPDTPDEVVHDLRIHCKKLRYLMEFFGPLFDDKGFKTIIKPLKRLQDNLGLFNDCSVQQEALLEFVSTSSGRSGQINGQLAMAVGGLIAVLDQRQRQERDRVIANFEHFDSPKIRQLFRTLFHSAKE